MNLTLPVSGAWRTTAIDLGQWLPGGSADGRNRCISLVAKRSGEGPLTEPTAAAQPRRQEPLFMPLKRPSQRAQGPARFVVRTSSAEVTKQAGYCEFTRKRISRQ